MTAALIGLAATCIGSSFLVGIAVGREMPRRTWERRCTAPWPDID